MKWAVVLALIAVTPCLAGQQEATCFTSGKALLLQHQFSSADTQLRECVARDPNDNASWELLGLTLASEGDIKEGGEALERALNAVPGNREFRINLAVFLAKNNWIDAAGQVLQPLLGSDSDANVDRLIGYIRLQQRQEREAIIWFERALQLDPESIETLYRLGFAYHSMGDLQKATGLYRRALELDPNQFFARLQLGKILLLEGDYSDAERELVRAAQVRPGYPSTWRYLSETQLFLGDPQAALISARTAVERGSRDPRNHYQLGRVLTQLGENQAARAELEIMRKLRASQRGTSPEAAEN